MAKLLIIIGGIVDIVLGSAALYKQPRSRAAQGFFVFTFSAAVWMATNLIWHFTHDYDAVKLTYSFGVVFAVTGLIWAHLVSEIKFPRVYRVLFVSAAILFVVTLFDDAMNIKYAAGTVTSPDDIQKGYFFDVYSAFMFLLLLLILYRLFQGFRKARGLVRLQRKYVFIGGVLYLAAVSLFDFVIPTVFNTFEWAFIDGPATTILIGLTAYATLRYRLMEVQILLRRSFVYAVIILFSHGFYILTVWFIMRVVGSLWKTEALLVVGLFAVVYVLIIRFVERFAVYIANTVFYSTIYNAQEEFGALVKQMVSIMNLQRLSRILLRRLSVTLGIREAALVILTPQSKKGAVYSFVEKKEEVKAKEVYIPRSLGLGRKDLALIEEYAPLLAASRDILSQEELLGEERVAERGVPVHEKVVEFFKKSSCRTVVPLHVQGKPVGCIVLGEKNAGRTFTKDDFALLDSFARTGAIAIDNALLYHDLEEKNKHLKHLLKTHKEFLEIASHQLRTPISIVRGAANLLQSDKPMISLHEGLKIVYDATIRLGGIVDDMLLASKLDSGDFHIARSMLEEVTVSHLLSEILRTLRVRIEEQNIWLSVDCPPDITISVYPPYFSLLIENLIDNGIKYTYASTPRKVWIEVKRIGDVARIAVRDNGIGISPQDQGRIFQKFVRTKTARKNVPVGTGLGLFILRKVIKEYPKGRYGLESTIGKGSTFWIEVAAVKKRAPQKRAKNYRRRFDTAFETR